MEARMTARQAELTPTLYYSPGACSFAAHIVLEEIGRPFTLVLVSTATRQTRSPEFLRINPKGRVPVLATGDRVLTEVPAILVDLAMSNPAADLMPIQADGLVRAMEWFNWLSGTVHAVAIRQIWRPEYFTDVPEQHADISNKGRRHMSEAFEMIEQRLNLTDWAVGQTYSIVDAYILVFYRWGNRMGIPMRERYSGWTRHALRTAARPAVGRAIATEAISLWE
jgi:glutathione S-transferase